MTDRYDAALPVDALRCPFCASTNIRPVGTTLPGRLDCELLIVCLACEAGFALILPAAQA